ncbi:MAG TPA: hypothetical protein PKL84_03610 [Candidatus Hydrogenedentes bacterium]|nr:hypothetical protein [Candidatus Hydrogenedentota bacterium]
MPGGRGRRHFARAGASTEKGNMMLEDFFGFLLDTLLGIWDAIVMAWFFVFGWIY